MELEEAIKKLEKFIGLFYEFPNPKSVSIRDYEVSAIETVLQELQNSIPKKKIENEIEILKAQCGGNVFHIQQTLNAEIRLLQDLLKDK